MVNDRDYFLTRAAEEDAKAAACENAAAKGAHERLADFYRQVAQNLGPKPLHEYRIGDSDLYIL